LSSFVKIPVLILLIKEVFPDPDAPATRTWILSRQPEQYYYALTYFILL